MWKILHASAVGTSHQLTGQGCQDYCGGRLVPLAGDTVLVAACADGAGTAEHSDIGARLAVDTFLSLAERHLVDATGGETPLDSSIVEAWAKTARATIFDEAEARGFKPRQLACTFLAAIAGPTRVVFLQIGDGVIVCDSEEGYQYAFWPDSGEYANTTRFLTDADYERHLRSDILEKPVAEIALLTDGLQMLALDFAARRVHGGFFRPMFETLGATNDVGPLRASLAGFLDSKRVNDRTDDDKTLFLATRRAPMSHASSDAIEAV
jgi:Protein phosphatase 2C